MSSRLRATVAAARRRAGRVRAALRKPADPPLPTSLVRLPPSYQYKLSESIRRQRDLAERGARMQVWQHNAKPAGYQLATHCGVATPVVFERSVEFSSLTEERIADFGDRFVIKPHSGAASRGVHLLVRRDDGRFLDLLDRSVRSWEEVLAVHEQRVAAGHARRVVSVEELLRPAAPFNEVVDVPDDWKIYCCYDEPVMVVQSRPDESGDISKRMRRGWSPDWTDLGEFEIPDKRGPDMDPPLDPASLIDAATAIGRALKAPFVRIDLYETDRGVVFGEITPHPGAPYALRADIDQRLGRAWERAEARLMAEGVPPVVPRATRSSPSADTMGP